MRSHRSSTLSIPEIGTVPRHIAMIMDGNGRWATKRFLPRIAGHAKGMETVRRMVTACGERGVGYLTLFAFSSENWRRPSDEVGYLLSLFSQMLLSEVDKLAANGVRLRLIGDLSRFDTRLQELIAKAEEITRQGDQLQLTIAANYGGRWDILQAINALRRAQSDADTEVPINEEALTPYLAMAFAPEPDLFIRSGGEQRISNFLLWQLAYSELYFTEALWPDMDEKALDAAIDWYRQRERRFGRTSEQLHATSATPS